MDRPELALLLANEQFIVQGYGRNPQPTHTRDNSVQEQACSFSYSSVLIMCEAYKMNQSVFGRQRYYQSYHVVCRCAPSVRSEHAVLFIHVMLYSVHIFFTCDMNLYTLATAR